jgi:serine/threonine protein kinase/TPR repeat protein
MKTCPQCDTGYPDSHTTCPTHGLPLNEIRDLKPGMVIHQSYRIIRKLGQGGMGAVYLAQHTLMNEPQALKFLSSELSQDEAFTARFLREVRTLRQIRNRNVVDCGDLEAAEDDSLFFSMEFVESPDLRGLMHNTTGPFPVPLALSIARQIAEGLGAAHAKGMVHRDIKPENILMARNAGAWLPKIADFGIVATKESSTAYTRTGGTLLTMAYAAPEQWRGTPAAQLDGRTDLYALGGLLYEMLTGQTPFHAENYEGWLHQHQTTPPQPPSTIRPDLANWQGLDALTLRLHAKDRNDRPKDVAELLGLLDAVRYLPADACRETVAERLKSYTTELLRGNSFRQMPRWVWITSALVLTLGITSTAISLSITPSTIGRRANILDYNHHYNLGGMLRKLACMRGHGESCNALADMYYSGNGVKQDLIHAHELYLRAAALYSPECTSGSGDACYKLAGLYKSGKGVEMDPSRADLLVKQSIEFDTEKCDAGDGKVCGILGLDYSVGGDPVQKDYVKSAEFYTKACNLGEADRGCIQLGTAYKFGWGVPESAEKAIEFYIKGCDLGEPYGCTQAGDVFDLGRYAARDAIQDYARAAALYSRACDAGDDLGCNNIGDLYRDGNGVPHDAVKARYYYSKSCSSSTNLHFGCDELKKLQ